MSGFKPVGQELLYSFYGAATTSTPTVSPGSTITGGYPACVVPNGYMDKVGSWSSSLQIRMGGLMTATATIPTWNFLFYAAIATTTAPAFTGSASNEVTLASTGTFTPSAATNTAWELDLQIGLRTLSIGNTSTIAAWGRMTGPSFNSAGYLSLPATGTYTPPANWDPTQSYVIWPALALGSATAGNTVTVQFMKLYGEN